MSTSVPAGTFFSLGDLGLPTTQQQFLALWLAAMQAQYPGYAPSAASAEYVQAQIVASWAAITAQLCTAGGNELFRQFLTQLLGLPYENGTAAQALLSVEAVDSAGYTLPALTQLTLTLNGSPVAFQTASALSIPSGSSSGQVLAVSLSSGAQFNTAGGPVQLQSPDSGVSWVAGITALAGAAGGVDQEDDQQYIQRGAQLLTTLRPSVVTASDAATMALSFQPAAATDQQQVGRASAIDGYNPATNAYNVERYMTVCVTDASGVALNSDTMAAVQAFLSGYREVSAVIGVLAPNYSTVYVSATVVAQAGYAPATVQANVQAALLGYLSPPNFGLPQGAITGWSNSQTISLSRVAAVIQSTAGVQEITPGTLAVDTQAPPVNKTADLALSGPFPLPQTTTASIPLSAITVTG